MSHPTPPPQPEPMAVFVGWLLVAAGALMTLLCGACTLFFWVVSLSTTSANGVFGGLIMVTLLGGLPTVAGVVCVWAGWRIVHPRPRVSPKQTGDLFE